MTRLSTLLLCSATTIDRAHDVDGVPEWVHLLPAGEIRTVDGRGPYTADLHAVAAASMRVADRLPIDECHSTDRAAPLGQPAPARGWIVELQAREDGLWGRVEWTPTGVQLMSEKAYRGISPAIHVGKKGAIQAVLRASLINTPNLAGLASLHSEETGMDWKARLIELLGLDSGADDAAIEAALSAKMKGGEGGDAKTELQSVLTHPSFVELQSALTTAQGQIKDLTDANARRDAVAFVDGAIAEGRVGVKPSREDYIALHMEDAARCEKLIGGLLKLGGETNLGDIPPDTQGGELSSVDRSVIALMGLDEVAYKANMPGAKKETL